MAEILFFGGTACLVILKFLEVISNKEAERERGRDKKRPPIYCGMCNLPNKQIGTSTAKKFTEYGPKNIRVCDDCRRRYSFCDKCGKVSEDTFLIVQNHYNISDKTELSGLFCKTCFEGIPRDFSSTRDAAHKYYGSECHMCGNTRNLEVHHKTYVRQGREHLDDLVVLCRKCHNLQHTTVHSGPRGGKYLYRKGSKLYVNEDSVRYQPKDGDRRK